MIGRQNAAVEGFSPSGICLEEVQSGIVEQAKKLPGWQALTTHFTLPVPYQNSINSELKWIETVLCRYVTPTNVESSKQNVKNSTIISLNWPDNNGYYSQVLTLYRQVFFYPIFYLYWRPAFICSCQLCLLMIRGPTFNWIPVFIWGNMVYIGADWSIFLPHTTINVKLVEEMAAPLRLSPIQQYTHTHTHTHTQSFTLHSA